MKYIIDIHHGIGDLIHMFPAIKALKGKDAKVDVVVAAEYIAEFLKSQNIADNIFVLNKTDLIKRRLLHLNINYDYGIVSPCIVNVEKSSKMLRFLGAKKIITEENSNLGKKVHRVERGLSIIEKLGISCNDKNPHVILPEKTLEDINNLLTKIDLEKKTIAICTGGNDEKYIVNGETKFINIKRWPIEYYYEICERLIDKFNVILIGGKREQQDFWGNSKSERLRKRILDYTGKTTLIQTAALLKKCDLVLGNDTGMIHMAAAVGTTTMTIFCSTNPKEIGAYADNAIYIEEYLPCKYCYVSEKTYSCKTRECINQIKPEKVLSIVYSYFDQTSHK